MGGGPEGRHYRSIRITQSPIVEKRGKPRFGIYSAGPKNSGFSRSTPPCFHREDRAISNPEAIPDDVPFAGTALTPALAENAAGDQARPETGMARRSARNFLWSTLAWGSNRIVILGLTLLLARLLVPADFGVVTAALTIISMLDAALDLGVGAAVVTEQETGVTHRTRTAATLNIAVATGISIIGIACSGLLADLFNAHGQAWLFALIFVYPFFRGLAQVSDAVLKRDLRFRRRTLVDIARAVVRVAVSVPIALTIGGPLSIAAGIVAAELVAAVMLASFAPVRPTVHLQRTTVKELLGFGGQVTVIRVFGSFRSGFDYIVVGSALGTVALGFYGMAYKLPELLIENVLWIFATVSLPTFAQARNRGHESLFAAMLRAIRVLTVFGLFAGVTLAVLSRDAMPVLFSPQWTPAVIPMLLISLSLGIMAIAWASGDVFAALGMPGTLLKLDIPATILMGAAFLFSTHWGLIGVACVHLVFNIVYSCARLALVVRVLHIRPARILATILPGIAVGATTAAVGFAVRAVLPAGSGVSLLVLALVCGATGLIAAGLFARSALAEIAHFLPIRRRTPVAAREGHAA